MMNKCKISGAVIALAIGMPFSAFGISTQAGDFKFDIGGYGTAGFLEPDFETAKTLGIGDFRVRTQVAYNGVTNHTFGAVYTMDEIALDEHHWMHEAFGFWQWRHVGRIEAGFTDSVAHKLGLGLPDVGGLRMNDNPILYRRMSMPGPVIANTVITNGSEALRLNVVSASSARVQYGFSASGLTGDYDYSVDAGIKIKHSTGKTKYALSLGASFIGNPSDYATDTFTPDTTADWRAQTALGLNIQYNSFIFAVDGRIIYDQNPVDVATDGFVVGTGISYDLLKYTISLTYLFSDTGVWHDEFENEPVHTALASFRYKYSENLGGWMSVGITADNPFFAVGLKITF